MTKRTLSAWIAPLLIITTLTSAPVHQAHAEESGLSDGAVLILAGTAILILTAGFIAVGVGNSDPSRSHSSLSTPHLPRTNTEAEEKTNQALKAAFIAPGPASRSVADRKEAKTVITPDIAVDPVSHSSVLVVRGAF